MKKIEFLRDAGGRSKGDQILIEAVYANTLILNGFARLVESEPTPLEAKTPEKVESKRPARKPVKR